MGKCLNVILLNLWITKLYLASFPETRDVKSFVRNENKKLLNTKHFVKHGINEKQCFNQCFYFPTCHSINFNEEKQICMTNYEVEKEDKDNNMVSENGWIYYEKKDTTCFWKELTLVRGNHIYTIPYWSKQWEVSLELKLKGISEVHCSIFRFSNTSNNCCNIGDRNPALFTQPNEAKIGVRVGNEPYVILVSNTALQLNVYHTIIITQKKNSSGKRVVTMRINGIVDRINDSFTDFPHFKNVKVYASDDHYNAANVDIRNFCFRNL